MRGVDRLTSILSDKKGRYLILGLIILIGIVFVLIGKEDKTTESQNKDGVVLALEYKAELERTAAYMCSTISGVEAASVNITLDGSMSCIYAKNSEGSYGGTYFSSGGEPLLLKYDYPEIVGCAVICNRNITDKARLELTSMLSAYLGISSNKIYVGYKN